MLSKKTMFYHELLHGGSPSQKQIKWLIFATVLFVILNPYSQIDILLTGAALFFLGIHVFQEKLLLVFLLLRPALDMWRDVTLIEIGQISLSITAAFSLGVFVWGGYNILLHRDWNYLSIPGIIALVPLALLILVSSEASISLGETVIEALKFTVLVMLYSISFLFIIHDRITPRELLLTTAASAAVPIGLALLQLLFGTGITTFGISDRIYGSFAHPNVFAFFCLSLLFVHVLYTYMLPGEHKGIRLRHGVTGLLVFLLLFTFTRGAWVGLAIFVATIGILHYRKVAFGIFGSILAFYLLFPPVNTLVIQHTDRNLQEIQVIERLTTRNDEADSLAWRGSLVSQSIPTILRRPLFGFGYGTFPTVWTKTRTLEHINDDSAEAHNDFLRLGVETGLVGLGLYIAFLIRLLWITTRTVIYNKSADPTIFFFSLFLFAWVSSFAVMSLADNMLNHTAVVWLTWIWWGAGFGYLYKYKKLVINFLD